MEKKLLILTQKVDSDDPVLGFFHGWLLKLSRKIKAITVVALGIGKYSLPENVKVFSLGKEERTSRFTRVLRFYKYIFKFRNDYNVVFVHMNQEYVLLGGIFWKLMGKKIYLWRNHRKGNFLTPIAGLLSNEVFYTSPDSFTANPQMFKNAVQMPVGIDTEKFTSESFERKPNSILSLGRLSPVKNINIMIKAARILHDQGTQFTFDIYGDPVNPEDFEYARKLKEENNDLVLKGIVTFHPGVPNHKVPEIFSKYEILINLTPPGSFDKTILEAAASECVPWIIHTKINDLEIVGVMLDDLDPRKNAARLQGWFDTSEQRKDEIRAQLRNYVQEKHSLDKLVDMLVAEFEK